MFDHTDPELEAKAPGAVRVALLLGGVALGWAVVVAAYCFADRIIKPAAAALWRAF